MVKEKLQDMLRPKGEFEEHVLGDKIELLYKQSAPAAAISLIAASLSALILWGELDRLPLLVWYGTIVFSSIVRTVIFVSYKRFAGRDSSLAKWGQYYSQSLLFTSLAWGVGSVLVMPSVTFVHQAILYTVLVGMAGGSIAMQSSLRRNSLITTFCLLIPPVIWFISRLEMTPVILGALGCIFIVSGIRSSQVISRAIHESFLMKYILSDAKQKEEIKAKTDFLTGLFNRRAFFDGALNEISVCQSTGQPVSAMLVDLDYFKQVNDTHGHESGDQVLVHFAKLLRNGVRPSDICGRLGGEEFAVLFPNTDIESAFRIAETLRITMESKPIDAFKPNTPVTLSAGVAAGSYQVEKLLKMADDAMYQAKESGRNRVVRYHNGNE